jgi:hypothetical protein
VDDRFGIDLINVGNNNTVRYNLVHSQGSLPGGPYYSGGIRFDGNDGSGTVLTESTGNTVYYNVVYDEHIGINVFSFSNVSVLNNTVVDTKLNGIAATAPAGVTPVNTVILRFGISSETFLRLFSRAPRIRIEPYIGPFPCFTEWLNKGTWPRRSTPEPHIARSPCHVVSGAWISTSS